MRGAVVGTVIVWVIPKVIGLGEPLVQRWRRATRARQEQRGPRAGVVVGDGSDIGGGASIMGTLSGGGKEQVTIGEGALIGANGGIGISLGDRSVVEAGCYVTAGTKVTITDANGNVISWGSAGRHQFRGSRKSTAYAAQVVAQDAARKIKVRLAALAAERFGCAAELVAFDGGQVSGGAVADGDGGARQQQLQRHRPADNIGCANDHRVLALGVDAGHFQHGHHF